LFLAIRYFTRGIGVEGWTSVIVSIYFIGGLLLANLGVIGLYLGKVFHEVKDRPLFVVKETVNFHDAGLLPFSEELASTGSFRNR